MRSAITSRKRRNRTRGPASELRVGMMTSPVSWFVVQTLAKEVYAAAPLRQSVFIRLCRVETI
jgi:hypothetical protein